MKIADTLERRILSTTRILCLLALVVAVMAMIAVVLALVVPAEASGTTDLRVAASDVLSSIPGSETANNGLSAESAPTLDVPGSGSLVLPAPLQAALIENDAIRRSLAGWIANVPAEHRREFLNELSDVVVKAGEHARSWEWDDRERYVAAAMRQYARLKIERIAFAENALAAADSRRENLQLSMGTILAIAAFLTLLLLLISIERNTRNLRRGTSS